MTLFDLRRTVKPIPLEVLALQRDFDQVQETRELREDHSTEERVLVLDAT